MKIQSTLREQTIFGKMSRQTWQN